MWTASVVFEPARQSPEVITMILPALSGSQIDPKDPLEYVVFSRSLRPDIGWTQWELVASAAAVDTNRIPIQIRDISPLTDYQFRFRTESASRISPFSSVITFRTPAIGEWYVVK